MASAPPTGCEWRAIKTPDGRHTYYTNTRTNETTWTKPAGFIDANGRAQNKVEGTEWVEVSQPSGPSYFHNPKSGEVTWHAPEEVKAAFAALIHAFIPCLCEKTASRTINELHMRMHNRGH